MNRASRPAAAWHGAKSSSDLGNRIIKVNHADEHGAVGIYSGHLVFARFTAPALVANLQVFLSHERRHRATFAGELQRRGHRRCRSYWLCGVGGHLLGLQANLHDLSIVIHLPHSLRCRCTGSRAGFVGRCNEIRHLRDDRSGAGTLDCRRGGGKRLPFPPNGASASGSSSKSAASPSPAHS
jgi:hypothetical protein